MWVATTESLAQPSLYVVAHFLKVLGGVTGDWLLRSANGASLQSTKSRSVAESLYTPILIAPTESLEIPKIRWQGVHESMRSQSFFSALIVAMMMAGELSQLRAAQMSGIKPPRKLRDVKPVYPARSLIRLCHIIGFPKESASDLN